MSLLVDSALDFEEVTATPAAPPTGVKRLYFYTGGTLNYQDHDGTELTVASLDDIPVRAPATFFTNQTGTPKLPTDSSLGSDLHGYFLLGQIEIGDNVIRESDGRVFSWQSNFGGGGGTLMVDSGFNIGSGGSNAVTNSVARMFRAATFNVPAGAYTIIPFDTASFDAGAHLTTGATAKYTCPVAGYYRVSGQFRVTTTVASGTLLGIEIVQNGVIPVEGEIGDFPTTGLTVDDIVKCAAGDTLQLAIFSGQATTLGPGGSNDNYMSVQLVAPLTNAPVALNTGARAYRTAAFSLPANAFTKVPLDTIVAGQDPGGHIAGGSYKVSTTGWYQCNGQLAAVFSSGAGANMTLVAGIAKNGAVAAQGMFSPQIASDNVIGSTVSDLVFCTAGDVLELWGFADRITPLVGGPGSSYFSVVLVDQPTSGGSGSGAGITFASGTTSPTGVTGPSDGMWWVRQSDGEVFKFSAASASWVDQNISTEGINAVTNTICKIAVPSGASVAMPAGLTLIPFSTVIFDPGGCFNAASHAYVAPVGGYYDINAQIREAAADSALPVLFVNGAVVAEGVFNTANSISTLSTRLKLSAGDVVTLQGQNSAGTATTLLTSNATGVDNTMDVALVAPLTSAPVSPNTAARAHRAVASAWAAAGFNKLLLDTIDFDPGGHIDLPNARYKVTQKGTYQVTVEGRVGSTAAGDTAIAAIARNEAIVSQGNSEAARAPAQDMQPAVTDLVSCNVGDVISAYVFTSPLHNSEATGAVDNYMSVVLVDQPAPRPANTGWFDATLTNSWAKVSGFVAQYMKDADGFVHLRGRIAGGASGSVAFNLPAGFRPGTNGMPAVGSFNVSTAPLPAFLSVNTSGDTGPFYATGATAIGLDGVTFLAEN